MHRNRAVMLLLPWQTRSSWLCYRTRNLHPWQKLSHTSEFCSSAYCFRPFFSFQKFIFSKITKCFLVFSICKDSKKNVLELLTFNADLAWAWFLLEWSMRINGLFVLSSHMYHFRRRWQANCHLKQEDISYIMTYVIDYLWHESCRYLHISSYHTKNPWFWNLLLIKFSVYPMLCEKK